MKPKIIFPSLLSSDELGGKMDEWELRDCGGILDYNTIKEISNASNQWELKALTLKEIGFNNIADPKYRNKSKKYPIILILTEDGYEVLDGKHRLAMANAREDLTIEAYVGKIEN